MSGQGLGRMGCVHSTESQAWLNQIQICLMAAACGLSVANIYLAQPLLNAIAKDVGISEQWLGSVLAVTQIGYAIGLLFIVPLGDLLNRRIQVASMMTVSALALIVLGMTSNAWVFFFAALILGMFAVTVQILVACSAAMSVPEQSGEVVGKVTSGVVVGILLGRVSAGVMADNFGWRSTYVLAAALTQLIALALFFTLPKLEKQSVLNKSYIDLIGSVFQLLQISKVLRGRALLALLIFANFNLLWNSLGLMLLGEAHRLSLTSIGLFGFAGIAGALGASRAGKLADKGLSRLATGFGLISLFVAWCVLGGAQQFLWAAVVGVIVLDFGVQVVHVSNQNSIFKQHPDARSRVVAAYMLFYSLGSAIGAVLATTLFVYVGWIGVCICGGLLSLFALFCWWRQIYKGANRH